MEYKFTAENFEEEVLKSDIPVLVDFYADWCPPCKMMAPLVEKIAEEFDGRLKVGKLDVDANENIGQQYKVFNIPAFKIFKDGQEVSGWVGSSSSAEFKMQIEQVLEK